MKIAVIDGLGGGIGSQIVENLRDIVVDSVEIIALGTNSQATTNMLNKGASRGATGENAICYTVRNVDLIIGPIDNYSQCHVRRDYPSYGRSHSG